MSGFKKGHINIIRHKHRGKTKEEHLFLLNMWKM